MCYVPFYADNDDDVYIFATVQILWIILLSSYDLKIVYHAYKIMSPVVYQSADFVQLLVLNGK